jgi:hypothetical protein
MRMVNGGKTFLDEMDSMTIHREEGIMNDVIGLEQRVYMDEEEKDLYD